MVATTQPTDAVLIERYIDMETDDRGPAYARLTDYGTPVWAIIGDYLTTAGQDVAQVSRDYDVPVESVEGALAFYRKYMAHINARLVLNDVLPNGQ